LSHQEALRVRTSDRAAGVDRAWLAMHDASMNPDLIALIVAPLIFASGLLGLLIRSWETQNDETSNDTRDLINRTTGLVATLSALALGLLVSSATAFYSSQRTDLQLVSAKTVQLDRLLGRIGPQTAPSRAILKQILLDSYERAWGGHRYRTSLPPADITGTKMDALYNSLNALRDQNGSRDNYLLNKATDLVSTIENQRMQIALQVRNAIVWPLLFILVTWTSLLFFGFGLVGRFNLTSVLVLGVGAFAVGSAVFMIVELSTPYSGLLRMEPTPVLDAIAAIGK
jgi:hypothetical protein